MDHDKEDNLEDIHSKTMIPQKKKKRVKQKDIFSSIFLFITVLFIKDLNFVKVVLTMVKRFVV